MGRAHSKTLQELAVLNLHEIIGNLPDAALTFYEKARAQEIERHNRLLDAFESGRECGVSTYDTSVEAWGGCEAMLLGDALARVELAQEITRHDTYEGFARAITGRIATPKD